MALLTSSWTLDGLLAFMSFMLAAYLFMTRNFQYWTKRGVVQFTPVPFVGHVLDILLIKITPAMMLRRLYEESKGLPYVGFYIFDQPFLLLRDVELVKQILVKDFHAFMNKISTADPVHDIIGAASLFLLKKPKWKLFRSKLSWFFTTVNFKRMFETMREVAKDLDSHLESLNLGGTGGAVDVKNLCACFTTDIICDIAIGVKANALRDPNAPFIVCGKQMFPNSIYRLYELLLVACDVRLLVKITGAKFFGQQSTRFLRRAFSDAIKRRKESGEKRGDLIDFFSDLKKNHAHEFHAAGLKLSDEDLMGHAAIFFLAGFETTSTVMAFTLYELALNPDIQNTLRKEIHEALEQSGGEVTYDTLMSLPYLHKVASEALRMYPPLGFVDRVAVTDYKMPNSDLVLEKGTKIVIPTMGLHNDPEYYPNPKKFDPERFTEEESQKRPKGAYIPFGQGPRSCIGLRLGLMQTKLGVVQIIRNYEVTPCEKTVIPMVFNPKAVTTTANGGIHLNVRRIIPGDCSRL